jgi:NADH:ubiquinone oxidoreductase subunit H
MDFALLLEKSILILILTAITLGIATYLTYGERKVAAFLQDRLGPNRAGKFGLLQPLADAGKMFFKEELIPKSSEKLIIFHSALYIAPYRSTNTNVGSYTRYHSLQIMNNAYQKIEKFVGRNVLRRME